MILGDLSQVHISDSPHLVDDAMILVLLIFKVATFMYDIYPHASIKQLTW